MKKDRIEHTVFYNHYRVVMLMIDAFLLQYVDRNELLIGNVLIESYSNQYSISYIDKPNFRKFTFEVHCSKRKGNLIGHSYSVYNPDTISIDSYKLYIMSNHHLQMFHYCLSKAYMYIKKYIKEHGQGVSQNSV